MIFNQNVLLCLQMDIHAVVGATKTTAKACLLFTATIVLLHRLDKLLIMSLSRNEVNPLSVLGIRKLTFIPEHFTKLTISVTDIKLLDHWINYHLNSRYAIKKTLALDSSKKLVEMIEIGVEDPREITMLTLGCPYIHKK